MAGAGSRRAGTGITWLDMRRAAGSSPAAPCFRRERSIKRISSVPPHSATCLVSQRDPFGGNLPAAIRLHLSSGVAWSLRSSSISSSALSLCSWLPCAFSSLEIAPLGADTLYANQSPLSIAADVSVHVPESPALAAGVIVIPAWSGLLIYYARVELFNASPIRDPPSASLANQPASA
jgi:hypothetical protein